MTVLFENPFWVGLWEREDNGRYEACKTVFGAEPKDQEVYSLILRNPRLTFSPPLEGTEKALKRLNPKRARRKIRNKLQSTGMGTKAQQALTLMREQNKLERTALSRDRRRVQQERRFEQRQNKRKEKHRGH